MHPHLSNSASYTGVPSSPEMVNRFKLVCLMWASGLSSGAISVSSVCGWIEVEALCLSDCLKFQAAISAWSSLPRLQGPDAGVC
jgi:hypothetical protein